MKPSEHKIDTIQDILDCVNSENIDSFLFDLSVFLRSANKFKEKNGIRRLQAERFVWIDDNKNTYKITVENKEQC